MFPIDWFYCNQYQELLNTGRDGKKALKNGLILSSVCFTLNVVTAGYILFKTGNLLFSGFQGIDEYIDGKALGEVIGLILVAAFYFLLKYTKGSKACFDKVISDYKTLSEADQKAISKKAYIYMFGSIIAMLVCVFI